MSRIKWPAGFVFAFLVLQPLPASAVPTDKPVVIKVAAIAGLNPTKTCIKRLNAQPMAASRLSGGYVLCRVSYEVVLNGTRSSNFKSGQHN